jgi:hypothetical protein
MKMSGTLGGSKSKNKEKSSDQYSGTETTMPNILPSLQHPLNKVGESIGGILDWESRADGGRWGADFIAPASGLQNEAFGRAGQLGGWKAYLGEAAGLARGLQPFTAAQASAPEMAPMQGYDAAQGQAASYGAPRLGSAPRAGAAQAEAAQIGRGSIRDLRAGSLLDGGMDGYLNPYREGVVEAFRRENQRSRQIALSDLGGGASDAGAWGGSRHGVAEAEAARGYADIEAGTISRLLADGWDRAVAAKTGDLDRDFAAQQGNQQIDYGVAGQNAGFRQQTGLRNADALTQAAQYDAGLQRDYDFQQAGLDERALQFGADARNRFGLDHLGRSDAASRYRVEAGNTAALQAWQGGLGVEQFNAGQRNQVAAQNQQTQLAAAGLLGDLSRFHGGQEGADLSTLAALGGEQRAIDQHTRQSYLTLLQQLGGLLAGQPFGATTGQTTTKSGTSSGTRNSTGYTIYGSVKGERG